MHLGLHYGLENTSHYKCFQPSDIDGLDLHFDFSDVARNWVADPYQYIKILFMSGTNLNAATTSGCDLLVNSSQIFNPLNSTTSNFNNIADKPGVLKVNNEYIKYDTITVVNSYTLRITGLTRGMFGTTAADHVNTDIINFLIIDDVYDPRIYDRVARTKFLDIESNPASTSQSTPTKSGGYYIDDNSNTTDHIGVDNANKALFFNGADDVLNLSSDYTLAQPNFTICFVVRIPLNVNSASAVSLDMIVAGDTAFRAGMRLSTGNMRVRFNDDGLANNAEQQLATNNTNGSTSAKQFLHDTLTVITLTKDSDELIKLYYNSDFVATATYSTVDSDVTGLLISHIGRRGDAGGSSDMYAEMGEMLVYNDVLSDDDRNELITHLTTKWTGGL